MYLLSTLDYFLGKDYRGRHLNSGGLWEVVSIVPISNPHSRVGNASAGVGRMPRSVTYIPQDKKPGEDSLLQSFSANSGTGISSKADP